MCNTHQGLSGLDKIPVKGSPLMSLCSTLDACGAFQGSQDSLGDVQAAAGKATHTSLKALAQSSVKRSAVPGS